MSDFSLPLSFSKKESGLSVISNKALRYMRKCFTPLKKKIKRILLVYPPWGSLTGTRMLYIPLGLSYLASYIKPYGYDVSILNMDYCFLPHNWLKMLKKNEDYLCVLQDISHPIWQEAGKHIANIQPDLVGIYASTPSFHSACNIAKITKKTNPDIITVVGGPHVSSVPEEVIMNPFFDFAVRGEGEQTFLDLLECLNKQGDIVKVSGLLFKKEGQIIKTSDRDFIKNLDQIPFPERDSHIHKESYIRNAFGVILASRGCPYKCSWCASHKVWGRRTRFRSVKNIVDEVKLVYKNYGVLTVSFVDDTLTLNKQWVKELCYSLIQLRLSNLTWYCNTRADCLDQELAYLMAKAGCIKCFIGLESGNEYILQKNKREEKVEDVKKGIKYLQKAGIKVICSFIYGFEEENVKDILETLEISIKLAPYKIIPNVFTPYPGTESYEKWLFKEKKQKNIDWESFYHFSPWLRFSTNTELEFKKTRKHVLKRAWLYNLYSQLSCFLKEDLLNVPGLVKFIQYHIRNKSYLIFREMLRRLRSVLQA